MSVKVFQNTKIFVASPANVATGGPELLHQLAYHLRNTLGFDAYMLYYKYRKSRFFSPVHPSYELYKIPYLLKISPEEDNSKNILIVPEVVDGLYLMKKYRNIRKGVWFLSVDYYYYSKTLSQRLWNKYIKLFNQIPPVDIYTDKNLYRLAKKFDYRKDKLLRLADFYMTNSFRGMKWFGELKPLYYLSEYLNEEFLKIETDLSKKENLVAYNPRKGSSFTKKILRYDKGIKYVPLVNMTREEVIKTLQKAKVYIDFGFHPGKDRLPREAAILGCCVITGKRGSAGSYEDVPIPEEYKFEDKEKSIPEIIEKIRDCFKNYEKKIKDFAHYREVIKREPEKFIEDLKKIFVPA